MIKYFKFVKPRINEIYNYFERENVFKSLLCQKARLSLSKRICLDVYNLFILVSRNCIAKLHTDSMLCLAR